MLLIRQGNNRKTFINYIQHLIQTAAGQIYSVRFILLHISFTCLQGRLSVLSAKCFRVCGIDKIAVAFFPYIRLAGGNHHARYLLCFLNRIGRLFVNRGEFAHAVYIKFLRAVRSAEGDCHRLAGNQLVRPENFDLRLLFFLLKRYAHLFLHLLRSICLHTDAGFAPLFIACNIFRICHAVYAAGFLYPVQRQKIAVDKNIRRINTLILKRIFRGGFIFGIEDLHFIHRIDLSA